MIDNLWLTQPAVLPFQGVFKVESARFRHCSPPCRMATRDGRRIVAALAPGRGRWPHAAADSKAAWDKVFAPITSSFDSAIKGYIQGTTTLQQRLQRALASGQAEPVAE